MFRVYGQNSLWPRLCPEKFVHSNNHAIQPISAGIYICQMKRLGDNKTAPANSKGTDIKSMHFETGPKFVSTTAKEFPQINGMGLIHKSAAGSELGALSETHSHSQPPRAVSGERVPDTGCQAEDKTSLH